ncbi:hypothetical protein [Elioraea sp.]|uniref:hypothetical protein n=1 Tax=Elioraea sp. TaxID=2185103 RepID=UPI0025C081F5|nr:hypothetical protein [Elioraea sp.]
MENLMNASKSNKPHAVTYKVVFLLCIVLLATFIAVIIALSDLIIGKSIEYSLPILAISGVVVLIVLLTLVASVFSILRINDEKQAMGLPEGSIRAVIALSLIVLFSIFSVFLFANLFSGPPRVTVDRLSEAARDSYIASHPNAAAVAIPDELPDGTTRWLYNVSFSPPASAASEDFAKQLLVLLGTLMTAITSFYLGSTTATSAAKAAQSTDQVPSISSIDPTVHSVTKGALHLRIMGTDLNIITHVKLSRAGVDDLFAKNVRSNPTEIECDIAVDGQTTPTSDTEAWDVVVDDGGSKSATKRKALTIKA